jgi:hypothetical protein
MTEEEINGIIVWSVILGAYLLRNTPLGFIWKLLRVFLLVLLATLTISYAKKSLKSWWNKD